MLKIKSKISGWKVTGFETKPVFDNRVLSLEECMKTIKRQETMDFILTLFTLVKA